MMDRTKRLVIVAFALLLASGPMAEAAFVTPVGVTASNSYGGAPVANLINSSGMDFNTAAGRHDNHGLSGTMWMSNGGTVANEWLVFDLGASYDLSHAYIWQMNQGHAVNAGGARNTRTMDIYVSPDNVTYTQVGDTRTLATADGSNPALPAETVSLAASNVQYVKFDILTAGSGLANEYVGLSEVRFEDASVPPPPGMGLLFSEDFEGTGVADGAFALNHWPGTAFTGSGGTAGITGNILNPAGTGNAWLNPVPPALGEIFGVLHSGATQTADLTETFAADATYTFEFTQFRRDDLAGDVVTAKILTTGGLELASADFAAIALTDVYAIRELTYTTSGVGPELGQAIRLQLIDSSGGGTIPQVGIDNIFLSATTTVGVEIPEPSTFALWCLGVLGLRCYRRRRPRQGQ